MEVVFHNIVLKEIHCYRMNCQSEDVRVDFCTDHSTATNTPYVMLQTQLNTADWFGYVLKETRSVIKFYACREFSLQQSFC